MLTVSLLRYLQPGQSRRRPGHHGEAVVNCYPGSSPSMSHCSAKPPLKVSTVPSIQSHLENAFFLQVPSQVGRTFHRSSQRHAEPWASWDIAAGNEKCRGWLQRLPNPLQGGSHCLKDCIRPKASPGGSVAGSLKRTPEDHLEQGMLS